MREVNEIYQKEDGRFFKVDIVNEDSIISEHCVECPEVPAEKKPKVKKKAAEEVE